MNNQNPFKIVLEFETQDDAENWLAGYMDSGGDQTLGYDVDLEQSEWRDVPEYKLTMKGYRQCPDCRFGDMATVEEFNDRYKACLELPKKHRKQYEVKDKTKTHKCQNCYHECNEEDIVNA